MWSKRILATPLLVLGMTVAGCSTADDIARSGDDAARAAQHEVRPPVRPPVRPVPVDPTILTPPEDSVAQLIMRFTEGEDGEKLVKKSVCQLLNAVNEQSGDTESWSRRIKANIPAQTDPKSQFTVDFATHQVAQRLAGLTSQGGGFSRIYIKACF
ncbi:hypothetical protein ACFVAV_13335 [Nocardia sp. NPDC057663]|uniref:hypothetical protein n=1 Tax=Nocardia sp. NPDC057663 TaxID=3346201 RepID=UPI00366B3BE1